MDKEREIACIEDTLHALLTAATEERYRIPNGTPDVPSFRALSLNDLMTKQISVASEFIETRDPVGLACRQAIRWLGTRLYELTGDTDTMLEIAERVAERDAEQYGGRITILNAWWDGIGNWLA